MKLKLLISGLALTGLILFAVRFFNAALLLQRMLWNHPSCRINRIILDEARYWYALDNGMTNVPPLETNALATYVDSDTLRCFDGGTYSISPMNQHVICSVPEHMSEPRKGSSSSNADPIPWEKMFPLNYRTSDNWRLSLLPKGKDIVLRMSGATIIFQGLSDCGIFNTTILISGLNSMRGYSSDERLAISYASGVFKMKLPGHVLLITDAGRTLRIDQREFDLSIKRPMIVVSTNGFASLKSTE